MNKILEKESSIYLSNYEFFSFDTSSIEKRYRVVSETCDIEVNAIVKKLLDFISTNEGKKQSFIVEKFSEENRVDREDLENTFSMLLKKGILTNTRVEKKEIREEDFYRNKMEHFWFRKRLIDTEKYSNFFKFFSFVFSKPFLVLVISLFLYFFISLFLYFFISLFLLFDTVFVYSYFFTTWKTDLIYFSAYDYLFLSLFGGVSLFLHEVGHIVAAKRYNSKTGGIGVGIYYYMLVGYADVHETWNLPRNQRRVVSIAGFYWNLIETLPIFILYFYFGSKVMADFLLFFHLGFISVFNPFLKMDGYWFLSDTLGVPSLQNRIKIYFFQYLPSKYFSKLNVANPFQSYPEKTQKKVNVYIVLFLLFMFTFLSLFLYKAVNIAIDFESTIVEPFNIIVTNWNSDIFNKLLRNGFILFGGVMFILQFLKLLISRIGKQKIAIRD